MPGKRTLDHVALYFDDVEHSISHRFAGELLAIDEFNRASAQVKIDRWRGLENDRPFAEASYLKKRSTSMISRPSPRESSTGNRCTVR